MSIELSTREELDGLRSKRLTVEKAPMQYVGKDAALVVVFTHNCLRALSKLLFDCGMFDERWWPQTQATTPISTRSECGRFELSLNKLERMSRDDVARMLKELPSVAGAKWPYFLEVFDECVGWRDAAFDQYSGIRQVGDLRGVPGRGAALFVAAKREVDSIAAFCNCVFAFVFANVYNDVAFRRGSLAALHRVSAAAQAALAQLPCEYDLMIDAVVECIGCLRSKLARAPSGETYNDVYKKLFIADVITAASEVEASKRAEFNALIAAVDQLSEASRRALFESHGGRVSLHARAEQAFENIRPWAVEWLRVQQQAFGLREVFGDTPNDLCRHLDASKQAVIVGFRELLQSGAAEPIAALSDEMSTIAEQVKKARTGTAERVKK